jgi:hypothetical protein
MWIGQNDTFRKLIETFVSKKRFKDYLQKNIAAL